MKIVNWHVDTLILNVRGKLPDELAKALDDLQGLAKEAESDVTTDWQFSGQTFFIKPHGSKNCRWILTCGDSYLHLELSKGRLNGIICKVRFSSLLLHEKSTALAFSAVYVFLVNFLSTTAFTLQVGEVHICCDVAGWELSLGDAQRFVSQGRAKAARLDQPSDDLVRLTGRRCTEFKFSQGAAHSCDIYDKTMEVKTHQKEWFYAVWKANGWDGQSKVIRVEFRYKRACLNEMGIDEPYDMLGRLPNMWAYSTKKWLRHTDPDHNTNQSRWEPSAVWEVIQGASGEDNPQPEARIKKVELDTERAQAGFVGYASSWAIRAVWLYEAQQDGTITGDDMPAGLPIQAVDEDGGGFLAWAYDQMQAYLKERKAQTFTDLMHGKGKKLLRLMEKAEAHYLQRQQAQQTSKAS
ncbi:MAG: hypothetical protein H0X24_04695 [Ktedonobacterales bacterium]|nr:hypothetical protein [Ktedonobacterales bacterium]